MFLVEDSIVRSTTMKVLLNRVRELGRAREIHVRVACPPIVAPCFYGIDFSRINELFAPKFLQGGPLTAAVQAKMAAARGPTRSATCRSSRLPVPSASTPTSSAGLRHRRLPHAPGQRLYQVALENARANVPGQHLREPRVA